MVTSPRPTAISSPAHRRGRERLGRLPTAPIPAPWAVQRFSHARSAAAQHDALFLFLVADPGLDLVPRSTVRTWESQSLLGLALRAGQDLDGVPLQLPVQGRDATVDLGTLTVNADLGVH